MSGLTPRALLCDLMDELDAKDGLSRNARAQRAFERRRLGTSLDDAVFQRACSAQAKAVDPAPNFIGPMSLQDCLEAAWAEPVNPWLVKPSPEKPMKESDYNNMMSAQNAANRIRAYREPRVKPAAADLPPIDTSTTAGKIAVMKAYERGERIESTPRNPRDHAYGLWTPVTGMAWNWGLQDYRIAPPPAPRSALKIAQDYNRNVPPTGGEADTNLRGLLQSFTAMPVLYIHGSGSQANIDWTKTDSRPLTPGRYRLVRDDE
jgi:hypothetical protein